MLITSTAVQKWRSSGLSMVPTKDASAQVTLAQQCLKTSHPSQLAKKELIDEFRGDIKYQKSDHPYQHGLNLRDNDLFDDPSELKKKLWNEIHSEVMDREKQIKDTQRFFQNSDNILGPVRVASEYRLKKSIPSATWIIRLILIGPLSRLTLRNETPPIR
jgi:hypothetical protein